MAPRARTALKLVAKKTDANSKLADRVLAFAQAAQGRQVGDGECFWLADQALSNAGARSAASYTDITPDGDYVWGKPVPADSARPGDILQFRNFRIMRHVTTIVHSAAGDDSSDYEETEERDHHTAVVAQNLGTTLTILEQNVEPLGRIVQRDQIEITSGTTRTIDSTHTTETTTEVTVEGTIAAYRPQQSAPSI